MDRAEILSLAEVLETPAGTRRKNSSCLLQGLASSRTGS